MKKLSRMESNKEARRVLNRHQVDLGFCQCSCFGSEIRMTGQLYHHDGTNLNAGQVEGLIHDFQRSLPGYTVCGDMDNWKFSSDHISFLGERKKSEGGAEESNVVYEIDLDDYDLGTG